MASVAMLIGGALANALAFTGSSYPRTPLTLREHVMMRR